MKWVPAGLGTQLLGLQPSEPAWAQTPVCLTSTSGDFHVQVRVGNPVLIGFLTGAALHLVGGRGVRQWEAIFKFRKASMCVGGRKATWEPGAYFLTTPLKKL